LKRDKVEKGKSAKEKKSDGPTFVETSFIVVNPLESVKKAKS